MGGHGCGICKDLQRNSIDNHFAFRLTQWTEKCSMYCSLCTICFALLGTTKCSNEVIVLELL